MNQFNDFRVLEKVGYNCSSTSCLSFGIQRGGADISVVCVSIVSLESFVYFGDFPLVLRLRIRKDTMPINTPVQLTTAIAPVIIPTIASVESVSSSEKQT